MAKAGKTSGSGRSRGRRPGTEPSSGGEPEDSGHATETERDELAAETERDGRAAGAEGYDADDAEGLDEDPELDDEALVSELAEQQGLALVDVDDGPEPTATRASVAKYDPMAAYMQEVRRIPLLSREDEHELAVRYRELGDLGAARTLIESNLRLVVKIAYEYRRAYRNVLDLVQEGNVGLLQAVRKYDPTRGVKLSSYAAWWIRAYILKFILNNWRLVKIGTTQAQRKLFFNLRKEREKLEQLGFRPDPKLLAERLDVTERAVIEMERRLAAPDASLDAPLGDDEGGVRTRLDLFDDESAERPDQTVEKSEFQLMLRDKLAAFGAELEGRDRTIFERRWLSEEPMTLQQIGDEYGISRERARQIEKRLMDRLRSYLEREFGGEVDISALTSE
jgi:RNA polymerase sigma-32 factor